MLSIAIDLCKNVLDFLKKEEDLRLEQKLRIASILQNISNILKDTAQKLRLGDYPHYNCVLMEKLSNELHLHLIDYVRVDELDNLHKVLIEASQVEKQFALREEPETIPEIEKAAAEFESLSMFIRL